MNSQILLSQILREYYLLFNIVVNNCYKRDQKILCGHPLPGLEPAALPMTKLDGWGQPLYDFIAKSEGLVFSRIKYRYLPYFRNFFASKYKFKYIAPFEQLIEKYPGKYESVLHPVERDIRQGVDNFVENHRRLNFHSVADPQEQFVEYTIIQLVCKFDVEVITLLLRLDGRFVFELIDFKLSHEPEHRPETKSTTYRAGDPLKFLAYRPLAHRTEYIFRKYLRYINYFIKDQYPDYLKQALLEKIISDPWLRIMKAVQNIPTLKYTDISRSRLNRYTLKYHHYQDGKYFPLCEYLNPEHDALLKDLSDDQLEAWLIWYYYDESGCNDADLKILQQLFRDRFPGQGLATIKKILYEPVNEIGPEDPEPVLTALKLLKQHLSKIHQDIFLNMIWRLAICMINPQTGKWSRLKTDLVIKRIIAAETRQEIYDVLYPGCRKNIAVRRWEQDKEMVTIKITDGFSTGNIPEGAR